MSSFIHRVGLKVNDNYKIDGEFKENAEVVTIKFCNATNDAADVLLEIRLDVDGDEIKVTSTSYKFENRNQELKNIDTFEKKSDEFKVSITVAEDKFIISINGNALQRPVSFIEESRPKLEDAKYFRVDSDFDKVKITHEYSSRN